MLRDSAQQAEARQGTHLREGGGILCALILTNVMEAPHMQEILWQHCNFVYSVKIQFYHLPASRKSFFRPIQSAFHEHIASSDILRQRSPVIVRLQKQAIQLPTQCCSPSETPWIQINGPFGRSTDSCPSRCRRHSFSVQTLGTSGLKKLPKD